MVGVGWTVRRLIQDLRLNPSGIAVAVNQTVVPQSQRGELELRESDTVEIIQAVGGG
jgi:thiamine biosynthesis protein ThiS